MNHHQSTSQHDSEINLGNPLKNGWRIFKRYPILLITLSLIYISISFIPSYAAGQSAARGYDWLSILITVVGIPIDAIIAIGLIKLLLKIHRGESVRIRELFSSDRYDRFYAIYLTWYLLLDSTIFRSVFSYR